MLQASLDKEKNLEPSVAVGEDSAKQEAVFDLLTSRMNELAVSSVVTTPSHDSGKGSEPIGAALDIDKRIRALKKKVHHPCFTISIVSELTMIVSVWGRCFDVNKYGRPFVLYVQMPEIELW